VKPGVLCDTNIFVSAFIAGGPPSRLIDSAIDSRIELVLADPVLDELKRVLTNKLGLAPDRVEETTTLLHELATERIPIPAGSVPPISGDSDDDLILACAVHAGVHILVSGDRKHLLPLREHEDVRIITAQTLLAELVGA